MIPAIVHHGYFGRPFISTPLNVKCFESWRRWMPDAIGRFWSDETAPKSDFFREAVRRKPIIAHHYVQYWALYNQGGYWMDNDMQLVAPLEMDHGLVAGFQRGDILECSINNAIVGAAPGHPIIKRILDRIEQMDPGGWPLNSGPGVITDELLAAGIDFGMSLRADQKIGDICVYAPDRFYPWRWDEMADLARVGARTLAIHWWEGGWRE